MTDETHDYQFTALIIPKHIVDLFHKGDINATEMLLVSIIHALAKKDGCYASNAYLAGMLNIHQQSMSRMIRHLREMGLVQVYVRERDQQRLMKTYFNECENWPAGVNPNVEGGSTLGLRGVNVRVDPAPSKEGTDIIANNCGRAAQGFGLVGKRSWCDSAAHALSKELSAQRLLMRPPNLKAWAAEFQAMLNLGISKQEIKETIIWYTQNIREPYMPQAYSAKSFRDKYPQLRKRMTKQQSKGEVLVKPNELSPKAEAPLYEILQHYHWPKGSKLQLPYVIQASVANFRTYMKKADSAELKGTLQKFNFWMRAAHFATPASSLERYFIGVFDRLAGWDEWGGDLSTYIWSPDIKHVQQQGRQHATDYSNDPELYARYLEALGYAR
jgi:biotin operon repressor